MPDVIQWSLDQFYNELLRLNAAARAIKADLSADYGELEQLWTSTFYRTGGQIGPPLAVDTAQRQALVAAQIRHNKTLQGLYDVIHGKLVQAVNAGSSALRGAGYAVPTLAGPETLGFVLPALPVIAVTIIVAAAALVATVTILTASQRERTHALVSAIGNPNLSPAEVTAIRQALDADAKNAAKANPLNLDALVPILGIVAVIIALPAVLPMLTKRSAA